jgi:radical SAM superfamily enzyme YgiQ (UPF0313 family)
MKTLLIYPPFHRLHGLPNRFFPIGLGYLAGALKAAGHEAAIYNAENYDDREGLRESRSLSQTFERFDAYQQALDDPEHHVWKETRDVIAAYKPRVVGITTKSCMIPSAQIISRIAKAVDPGITVIWGGPHPSIAPDETIGFENVDLVARHEGEQTIVEVAEAIRSGRYDWRAINGLVWRDEGQVVHNRLRMNVPDINAIAFPDKSADLMPSRYQPDDYGVMFTSRGCPWPCTFCDSRGVWTRKIRYRSPENVVAEMERLYEQYKVRDFYFWDDTFTPNRTHSLKLLDRMIAAFQKQRRPITWQATTRCDCVDDELAAKMNESGCRLITYGVETGNPRMMEILRKGITHDKVFHAQRVMKKAGIAWDAFFMIGFPDDTPQTVQETMDLVKKLECRSVGISIFTPYPGLEIFDRAKSYGLIPDRIEWRHYSHQSPKNHFVKNISREDFHRIAQEFLAEIDRLNATRYRRDRLRYYATNPHKISGLLWRKAKDIAATVGSREVAAS